MPRNSLLLLLLVAQWCLASKPGVLKTTLRRDVDSDRIKKTHTFDQRIDHSNPSLGTFKQRYWINTEWYKPGGPIVVINAGEQTVRIQRSVEWLKNTSLNARIAQENNGAVLLLEHRFFGFSQPFDDLSSKRLKYLTVYQACKDNVYFAQNARLPITGSHKPSEAPWILTGGSYPGALVSWTMTKYPGVFYAGYSSSGVVQAITNFWQYNEPIRKNMPQNCSADVSATIAHIDKVFTGDDQAAINEIKSLFGVSDMKHLDDFADMLDVFGMWQDMDVYNTTDATERFYGFCDALELDHDGNVATEEGWGVQHTLKAWSQWFNINTCTPKRKHKASSCASINSHISLSIENIDVSIGSVNSDNRAWWWMVCNELGWFQTGAPPGHPTIVSRLVDVKYAFRATCIGEFPDVFTEYKEPSVDHINAEYGGWHAQTSRIVFATGSRDPWLEATVSSEASRFVQSPERVVGHSDGFHCTDMSRDNSVDESVAEVQKHVLGSMNTWLKDWVDGWNH